MLQNDDDGRVDERERGEEVDVDHRDAEAQTISRHRVTLSWFLQSLGEGLLQSVLLGERQLLPIGAVHPVGGHE